MSKLYIVLFTLAVLICTVGCKKKSKNQLPSLADTEESWWLDFLDSQKIEKPESITAKWDDIAYKSKLSFHSVLGSFEEVNVSIRLKQDSLIWLSASHLGFEVVRALIASDSIRILNRFQKQYIAADYATISRKIGMYLTYEQLESLLTGEVIYKPISSSEWFSATDSTFVFQQIDSSIQTQATLDKQSQFAYYLYAKMGKNDDLLQVENKGSIVQDNRRFPVSTAVELKSELQPNRDVNLSIQHQKIETLGSSASYPFSIPNNYKRIVL